VTTYGSTRGLRNHNPLNVRPIDGSDAWHGQVAIDNAAGGPFSIFGDVDGKEADFWGIRAGAHNFLSYQRKDGCDTIGKIITRHAPPTENETDDYIDFVCHKLYLRPDAIVDLGTNRQLLENLCKIVIQEEQGRIPYPNSLITDAVSAA
jgi:hypothetical protein